MKFYDNNKKGFGLKKRSREMPVAYYAIFAVILLAMFLLAVFLPVDLKIKTAVFFLSTPILALAAVFVYNLITRKKRK